MSRNEQDIARAGTADERGSCLPLGANAVRLMLTFCTAAMLAAVVDLLVARFVRVQEFGALPALYLTAVAGLGGLIVGLGLQLISLPLTWFPGKLPRSVSHPVSVLSILGLFALIVYANRTLFDGARISAHERLPLIKLGFYLSSLIVSMAVTKMGQELIALARRAWAATRLVLFLLCAIVAAGVYYVDVTQLTGQYAFIHVQLAIVAVLSLGFGLYLASITRRLGRKDLLHFVLIVLLMLGGFACRYRGDILAIRSNARTVSPNVSRWFEWPEVLLDRLAPLPEAEEVSVDAIIASWEVTPEEKETVQKRLDELNPARRQLNLLVVSIDTLRADHVTHQGYAKNITPNLDRLAEKSLVFNRCYTPFPTSSWAYSSFFSGRFPSASPATQIAENKKVQIDADVTLAGLLSKSGIRTHGRSAFNKSTLDRRFVFGHLKEGFDSFNPEQIVTWKEGPDLTGDALKVIRESKEQFFLWVHYLEPHDPYQRHPDFNFGDSRHDRYESEIAFTDRELGRLLKALGENGLAENTVVVVMSDHGEEFKEHGGLLHNSSLFEEQVRVPFVVHVPKLGAHRIDTPVSLVDFLPTVVDLYGLTDPHDRNGQSLWPLFFDRDRPHPHVYAELKTNSVQGSDVLEMVAYDNKKLIRDRRRRTELVFDLKQDPLERTNLLGENPETDAILRGLMSASRRRVAEVLGETPAPEEPVRDESWVRQEMARILALPRIEVPNQVHAFLNSLFDPVEGLDPDTARLFVKGGPLRAEIIAFLQKVYSTEDTRLAMAVMRMTEAAELWELIPTIKLQPMNHPWLLPGFLYLRAIAGDASVREELKAAYEFTGVHEKFRLMIGMLALGESISDERLAAALQIRAPLLTPRLLALLAKRQWPGLLDNIDMLLSEKAMTYPPVRRSMIDALASLPESPRRNRLLACLCSDLDRRIASRATDAFTRLVNKQDQQAWLKSGLAEMDGRLAAKGRVLETAAQSFAKAVEESPHFDVSQISMHARVLQSQRDLESAAAVLAKHPLEPRLAKRKTNLVQLRPVFLAGFQFAARNVSIEAKQMTSRFYFIDLELENTGKSAYPGGSAVASTSVVPVFLDAAGKEVEVRQTWPALIGLDDMSPGEKRRLSVALAAPSKTGTYQLAVKLEAVAPQLQAVSESQILGQVEVRSNLVVDFLKSRQNK